MSTRSLLAFYALALVQVCLSAVSNRTIDDFNGDAVTGALPVYEGGWNVVVDGNCTTCFVQPVSNQAFDHTWHDTTGQNSVTLQFTGTAIYFFGIVPNTVPFADTLVNVTFTVDGAFVGSYTHIPDTSSTILYNVPMLSAEGLSNKAHTLVAKVSDLLLFDFAIYTFDDGVSTIITPPVSPPTSAVISHSSTPKPTIVSSTPGPSAPPPSSSAPSSSSSGLRPSSVSEQPSSVVSSGDRAQLVPTSASGQADSSQSSTAVVVAASKSHFPVAAVVGSVCGAVVLGLLAFALLWCRRRKYQNVPRAEATPFLVDPTPASSPQTQTPMAQTSQMYLNSAPTSQIYSTQSLISNAYSRQFEGTASVYSSQGNSSRPLSSSVNSSAPETQEVESSVYSSRGTRPPSIATTLPPYTPRTHPSQTTPDFPASLGEKYRLNSTA